ALVKALPDSPELLLAQANPRIHNGYSDGVKRGRIGDERYPNLPTVGGEFHSVVQQIANDVRKAFDIGFYPRRRSFIDGYLQIDGLAGRRSADAVDCLGDHSRQVH